MRGTFPLSVLLPFCLALPLVIEPLAHAAPITDKPAQTLDEGTTPSPTRAHDAFEWNRLAMDSVAKRNAREAHQCFKRSYELGYIRALSGVATTDEFLGHGQTALEEYIHYREISQLHDTYVEKRILALQRNPTDLVELTPYSGPQQVDRAKYDAQLREYTLKLRTQPAKHEWPDEPNQQGSPVWKPPGYDQHGMGDLRDAENDLRNGDRKSAKRHLQRSLLLDPSNKAAYKMLFALFDDNGDLNAAHELIKDQLKQFPNDADFLYNLSYLLKKLKDDAGARDAFSRAAQLKPPNGI